MPQIDSLMNFETWLQNLNKKCIQPAAVNENNDFCEVSMGVLPHMCVCVYVWVACMFLCVFVWVCVLCFCKWVYVFMGVQYVCVIVCECTCVCVWVCVCLCARVSG